MNSAAQSAPSDPNHYEPSREEIIANILHVLSSSTEISPLLCRCDWGRQAGEGNTNAFVSWDPFLSFVESMPDTDSGVATHHSNFLRNWLIQLTNMGGVGNEDMVQIKNAFLDTTRMNKLLNDNNNNKPSDDLLWQAGLNLLKSHLFPDKESDTDNDDNAGSHSSMDPILPHELLLVVTDSYYCNDDDLEMGELAAIVVEVGMSPSEQVYRLPSSIAMFFLRTLLISRVLESAEESISDSRISSKPVRWRRLKSMVDDTLSLFQRMVFDYAGRAIDNVEYGRQPKSLKLHPVESDHVISIATWLYTNHLFPSCHDLLWVLLRNRTDNSNGTGASGVKILETCYDSFRMLTSLLALDVAVVDQEYTAPSHCFQWVLKRIESQGTSDFFDRVTSAQKEITRKDSGHDSMQDDGEEMYRPWNDKNTGFNGRGLSLEEDLLLFTSIRRKHDNSDKASSATFYDEMGIAVIAYWKLKAETDSSSLDPLPSPYCGAYRWTLLFPHVITFLCGSRASSTIKRMDKLECLSMSDDGYLLGINSTIISLGFDMLQTFITKTPAIRPMSCCTKTQNPIVRWAHSSQGLESTIAVLFSHVVRISYLEASTANGPPSDATIALKYSSLEVMKMTQTLLGFYNPTIQIHTLSTLCHLIMTNQERVLLPKALDFMRPIIMGMCTNIPQYNDDAIALDDMAIMQTISEVLGVFLSDLHYAFRDSTSSLPTDIDEFMSFAETFSSVFALIRLQRIWISRCQGAVVEELIGNREALELFYVTVKWMDVSLSRLQSFDSSLTRLIDVWERSEDRPTNWHRLFLMKLALQDALTQPDE